MPKSEPLIHTKLRLPDARAVRVFRPRLQEQVSKGLQGPLTLIVAPAGFGKTTLVASCIPGCGMPVAWLSLDKDDNQAGRFLNYMVAALQEADPAIGCEAAQLLSASQPPPPQAVLTSLINDMDAARRALALVVDDYQFISSPAVHEQLAFLLDHCPHPLHLVIASRSDPPLPLARLRARGQTVELRAADLSFTETEAARFLNEVMGLHLDAGSVAALKERTEGWIAGLQMAALSMRDRKDVSGFIEAFSGTNRYILDYLLEEVLAGQSPEIQRFLLWTSILERLSAPLCDAVLAEEEASPNVEAASPGGSGWMLEYLERANLFLVPLDDQRTWYRYHHLFAELLRAQLQKSVGAEGAARLHVRASEWHAHNGSILEAINHASMASDDERVERFIEQHYMEMVSRGEQSWLRSWTGKLSQEVVHRRPWLCIYEAYSHSWFGELDESDELLEAAERRIRSEIPAPDTHSMLAHVAYVRSRITGMRGDLERAIEFIFAARENLPSSNLALRIDMGITLGYLYFLKGDYPHAREFLNETIRSGRAAGATLNPVAAYCILARLYANQGRLHQSYELYQQAARWLHETGEKHLSASGLIEAGFADALCEWNELDSALAHVKQGLALLPWWGKADDLVLAYIILARIQLAQANSNAAMEAVEKATKLIGTRGVFPEAAHALELARMKLWLAQGEIQAAVRWAEALPERFSSGDPFRFENEVIHIARARVLIAQNESAEAIDLLSRLEEIARPAQRMGRVIETLLLKALALRESDNCEQAIRALGDCLELAEPEGYMRLFLDEGQPMRLLLTRWLAQAAPGPLRNYALRLRTAFDAEPLPATASQEKASPPADLIEPLSPRELEVLQLLALGCTNQEIARQLIVATGTVKAHTASIYRKLEAANRTGAVARARQLGLLS